MFSVIIPTFNRKQFLKKAIDSVLSQSFQDYELIIIDDGSNDGTCELISKYKDTRIKYIYQENKGVAFSRNKAIKVSNREYICPLDSDDWWDKEKLKVFKQYIDENSDYKIFHSQEIWYRNGELLQQKEKHKKPNGSIFPHCLSLCCVSISTAVIHKEVFSEIGMFDENLPACEDYDFWLRVSVCYPVFLIDKTLTLKDGGRPDQLSQKIEGLDKYRIIALEKLLQNPLLNEKQKPIVLNELNKRIKIYLAGCKKRNKIDEIKYYQILLNKYEHIDIQ